MGHTVLLLQTTADLHTRSYTDYESANDCMQGVCKIYEEHLKKKNPLSPSITYDIVQLFNFIDQVADMSCFVFQPTVQMYAPYNKAWIKEKVYALLKQVATQS